MLINSLWLYVRRVSPMGILPYCLAVAMVRPRTRLYNLKKTERALQ